MWLNRTVPMATPPHSDPSIDRGPTSFAHLRTWVTQAEGAVMQLGMIGLGRMGANLVRRLMRAGHECVVFDVSPDAVKQLESEGAVGATTIEEFVGELTQPRAAWIMVPAAVVDSTIDQLEP